MFNGFTLRSCDGDDRSAATLYSECERALAESEDGAYDDRHVWIGCTSRADLTWRLRHFVVRCDGTYDRID